MRSLISLVLAAAGLLGTTFAVQAQYAYPPYGYAYAPAPPPLSALPQSWSYDPYTSGLGPCPQKGPWDTQPCSQIMPPTYGQPSYWPTR